VKLPLRKMKHGISWVATKPFLDNRLAILIHRPRSVSIHKIGDRWKAHISVECFCGTVFSGTKKFTFLDVPPEDRLLCVRCEDKAVKKGMPSADYLSGRHVHVGTVKAIKMCCVADGKKCSNTEAEYKRRTK